jgi:hypothetical protein
MLLQSHEAEAIVRKRVVYGKSNPDGNEARISGNWSFTKISIVFAQST